MPTQPSRPLISVVIPNYNGAHHLEYCLDSLRRQTYPKIEIIIVDNNSKDMSIDVAEKIVPGAKILPQKRNLGFAGGVNVGIQASQGEWIAVLNNDTEVSDTWLEESMAAIQRHPDAAFLACRIMKLNDRQRVHSSGDCFLRAGIGYRRGQERRDDPRYHEEIEIFGASGCAALYRGTVLKKIGNFDETFFAYMEDVDLALRLQTAGHKGYYAPRAEVFHHGGATSGGEFSTLTVRLHTRNSLLLLVKNIPSHIFIRCAPMILTSQVVWMVRVLVKAKLWSYLRGLVEVLSLLRSAITFRKQLRSSWREAPEQLWRAIIRSEAMAREDFLQDDDECTSRFLKWYFRIFR